MYQAWDFAITEGAQNDYTVCATILQDEYDNLYVLDGHSRLEAFKRLQREEIPIQVVRGSEGEIARAADIANVSGTANTPIDQGRIAQRRIDATRVDVCPGSRRS